MLQKSQMFLYTTLNIRDNALATTSVLMKQPQKKEDKPVEKPQKVKMTRPTRVSERSYDFVLRQVYGGISFGEALEEILGFQPADHIINRQDLLERIKKALATATENKDDK